MTLAPTSAAASSFSGMPPTGPIVPSGMIIPVSTTDSLMGLSSNADTIATVIAAPAEGPPTIVEFETTDMK